MVVQKGINGMCNKKIARKARKFLYKNVAVIMIGNWIFYFIVAMIATIVFLFGFITFEALRVLWFIGLLPMICILLFEIFFL